MGKPAPNEAGNLGEARDTRVLPDQANLGETEPYRAVIRRTRQSGGAA